MLVRLQPIPHKRLELLRQAVAPLARDDVGVRLDQSVGVRHAHDRHLRHRRVQQQAAFHLGGGEPFARHLEQLVGSAAVGVVAVGVAPDQVARHHPLAPEAGLALVQLLPVAEGPRPAPHPEVPDRSVGNVPALLVRHLDLEAGHHLAQCPRANSAHSVGEEDVPHLGGAQPVEERNPEDPLPLPVQLLRQPLARGGCQAQRGEVLASRLRVTHHLVDHGGDGDQNGRPMPRDPGEDDFRGAAVVEQRAGGAGGEGEQQIGSGRVAEIELGHRERHIVLGIAEDLAGVTLRGVDERAMRLHGGLGPAGGAAGEEPDGGVVAVGGKVPPALRCRGEARFPLGAAHDQQCGCVGGPAGRGAKRVHPLRRDQRDGGAAVLEEILDGVRLELRVDHHYDRADLQDAEQRRHVVGPVRQGDDDALFRSHSRRTQHVGIAVGQCLNLTVAQPSGIGQQRGPVAPTFAHPGIEKEVGDVELLGCWQSWMKLR